MPQGFIFRAHGFFKNLKIMNFTQVLHLTETKTFGNIYAIEFILMVLTRLELTLKFAVVWLPSLVATFALHYSLWRTRRT